MAEITPAPQFSEPTPTVPLEALAAEVCGQLRRERDLFLALVDERERLLIAAGEISGPRTAQIRGWWREQQR